MILGHINYIINNIKLLNIEVEMKTCDNCKYQSTCFCMNCYVTVDDGSLYWAPKNQLNIEHSEKQK